MWRFWLGLPLDAARLGWRVLSAICWVIGIVWGKAVVAVWRLVKAVWWLILPSGLSPYDFPAAHFVVRAVAFYLLGAVFAAPYTVDWMMGMRPAGSEIVAVILVMVMLVPATAILAVVNLAAATELRRA